MSAKQHAVVSDVTRPIRCSGIRSKITAPRIGLRKPAANPLATITTTTPHSGLSSAITTNRGAPQTRNAARYVG